MKKHLLDNPDRIRLLDPQDMTRLVEGVPQQCQDARDSARSQKIPYAGFSFDSILICGVGGSAISGDFIVNYLRSSLQIPVIVNREYDLPAWVGKRTLVVCSSYSGETEETLAVFKQALAHRSKIVVIASGGTLLEQARRNRLPFYEMPGGFQPRAMVYYSFVVLLTLLEGLKLLKPIGREIDQAIALLRKGSDQNNLTVPTSKNLSKRLAIFFYDKNPVLYADESRFAAVVYRWKCQFNENAKQMAHVNAIPEMNHNEILSYTRSDFYIQRASVLLLRSRKSENARVRKRFEIFKRISGLKKTQLAEVWSEGTTLLSETLWLIYLGDFVSVYLAYLKGLNPTSIDLIDRLKHDLKK